MARKCANSHASEDLLHSRARAHSSTNAHALHSVPRQWWCTCHVLCSNLRRARLYRANPTRVRFREPKGAHTTQRFRLAAQRRPSGWRDSEMADGRPGGETSGNFSKRDMRWKTASVTGVLVRSIQVFCSAQRRRRMANQRENECCAVGSCWRQPGAMACATAIRPPRKASRGPTATRAPACATAIRTRACGHCAVYIGCCPCAHSRGCLLRHCRLRMLRSVY